jgi:hypothetical protein
MTLPISALVKVRAMIFFAEFADDGHKLSEWRPIYFDRSNRRVRAAEKV